MLEQKIEALIAALDKNTAALTGGKTASAPAASAPAASGKPAGKAPAAPKVTQEQVAEKASALKDAQGMPAVRALFKEHGAEDGKIASVPKANYAGLIAAIDAALAGDEPEAAEEDEGL